MPPWIIILWFASFLFNSQQANTSNSTVTPRLVVPLPAQLLDTHCMCAAFSTGLQKFTSSAEGSKVVVIVTALMTAAVAALICICEFKTNLKISLPRQETSNISLSCHHTCYTLTTCPTWILCSFISNWNKKPGITYKPRKDSITWKISTEFWQVSWSTLCLMLQEMFWSTNCRFCWFELKYSW